MQWNRIRRRVTGEINIEVANVREEILNTALSKAWTDYADALGQGRVPEVESRYAELVGSILKDSVPRIVEASNIEDK